MLCAFTYIIMQFQVPQFIDFEDKIFGPLSFKQFVYIAGGGGVIVVAYLYLPGFLFLLVALPIGTLAAALAFWQVNSRPFIITLEAAVKFFIQPKLFVWKKTADEDMPELVTITSETPAEQKSNLKSLSWELETENEEVGDDDQIKTQTTPLDENNSDKATGTG